MLSNGVMFDEAEQILHHGLIDNHPMIVEIVRLYTKVNEVIDLYCKTSPLVIDLHTKINETVDLKTKISTEINLYTPLIME